MKRARFLKWQEEQKVQKIVEFDEWAINLAKEKGFDKLKEEDIVRIVKESRVTRN